MSERGACGGVGRCYCFLLLFWATFLAPDVWLTSTLFFGFCSFLPLASSHHLLWYLRLIADLGLFTGCGMARRGMAWHGWAGIRWMDGMSVFVSDRAQQSLEGWLRLATVANVLLVGKRA